MCIGYDIMNFSDDSLYIEQLVVIAAMHFNSIWANNDVLMNSLYFVLVEGVNTSQVIIHLLISRLYEVVTDNLHLKNTFYAELSILDNLVAFILLTIKFLAKNSYSNFS